MRYDYHEDEIKIMRLRDNAINEQKRLSETYRAHKRFQRLGYIFLALIPLSIFMVFSIKLDYSNSGVENTIIYSDYKNSFFGWMHGGLIILFLYMGFKYSSRANNLTSQLDYEINNTRYTTSYEIKDKDSSTIGELKAKYSTLSDIDLEDSFRRSVQKGLDKSSRIQKLHYMALHEVFLGRFGFSPFAVEKYQNERTIELRLGRFPTKLE